MYTLQALSHKHFYWLYIDRSKVLSDKMPEWTIGQYEVNKNEFYVVSFLNPVKENDGILLKIGSRIPFPDENKDA